MECEYFDKVKDYGHCLAESRYWLILLAPDQRNLGTCVVALKRDETSLSGLNDREWLDFSKIVQDLESALQTAFPVTMFNWGCLLNSGYKKDPPDAHLHWHLIPRYNNPVKFADYIFKDPCFGKSTMHDRSDFPGITDEVRREIGDKIRVHLKYLNRNHQ